MDIEQLEALALGANRSTAPSTLLPGTVEHDYWRAVFLQHAGRLAEVEAIIEGWTKRHGQGYDEHHVRLRRRQLLLRAAADLPATAEELRREVGVVLDDRAEVVVQAQRYPTRLDPSTVDGDRLLAEEVNRRSDLANVTDWALPELLGRIQPGDATRRRSLLQRLGRANLPGLVELIATDLADKVAPAFGSLAVHRLLTLGQLEELAARRPALRTQTAWVEAVLVRLRPPSWVDPSVDLEERAAWLDRLSTFAATLAPSFNTVKAQILYRRLELDRMRGTFDRGRFLAYLELPRNSGWVARGWLGNVPSEHMVQPNDVAARAAGIEPIGDDEPLVRDYLARFLLEEDGSAFAHRIRAEWLETELATTRLLAGATGAEAERWARVLGPSRLAALRDRVDIDLAPQNAVAFGATDDVSLEVDVKNVTELEVKVFRINTLAHFLAKNADVDTSLDLDGMISGEETKLRFDMPPLRRTRQRIPLPSCARPGTYIVELIGNGRSSRALLRKGSLSHVVRVGSAGPVITIMDESGVPCPEASVWLGGREHRVTNGNGITIPFSTRPGRTPMLLVHGDIAQREVLDHPAETLHFSAGLHLERESLVPNQTARVLCRPTLTVGGAPASVALLEDPRVEISVADLSGTLSSTSRPIMLSDDRDSAIEIYVPDGVTQVSVRVRARARVVSTQETVELEDGADATVNVIHTTEHVASLHLSTTAVLDEGAAARRRHSLHVLGKTGEALAGRAVALALHHRNVTVAINTVLETDGQGAIDLGSLEGIEHLTAALPSGTQRTFWLDARVAQVPVLHATAGAPVAVPVPEGTRLEDLSLAELRGGAPAHDRTRHVIVLDQRVASIEGLAPGEYRLSGRDVRVNVMLTIAPTPTGAVQQGWALAGRTLLELTPGLPLVRSFALEAAHVVLRIAGAGPRTRVHVLGTRFRGDAVLPSSLHAAQPRTPLSMRRGPVLAHYVSGRDIGDEVRYVLERRRAARRPGTMLEKPSLLLNPWPLRTTSTAVQEAAMGGAYPASPAAAPSRASAFGAAERGRRRAGSGGSAEQPVFPSVDFLAQGAIVIDNLRPDADGCVRVPLADLGPAQLVQAIVVDPALTSTVELPLAPQAAAPRDLRLRLALDPAHHYAEDRSVTAAPAGTTLVVEDVRTGRLELIDTVARAHQLLLTLMGDEALRELTFVTEWPALDEATRRARYSKYACHELDIFLWRKDPAFFAGVIRPYLAHKRHKTFVDRFLLGEDLAAFLEPWAFGRLNTVERILLGASVPDVRGTIARLVGDEVDILPADPERDARLVATLLGASALEGNGGPEVGAARAVAADGMLYESAAAEEDEVLSMRSMAPAPRKMSKAKGGPGSAVAGGGGGYGDDLAADLAERSRSEPLYRGADKTQEWAETGWWKQRIEDAGPALITPNRFWRDLARSEVVRREAPFLSPHLGDCTSSFAEAMCALAFLDLPFVAGAHASRFEDTRLTLTPSSHALAARTRIVEVAERERRTSVEGGPSSLASVLVGQSYFRSDDRWEWDGAEQREKHVTGELLVSVVYRCQVVVTNPTSREQRLAVLLQIPRGSLPVASGLFTRTVNLQLSPYGTHALEYAFYFPRPGRFSHFPAHVTKDLELQAAAPARELELVDTPTTVDLGSWSHVSQHGSLEEVLAFLDRTNLGRIELGRIAWRMHDRAAFDAITARLAARHVYEDGLWRYALAHHDARRAAEWLRHQDDFLRLAGLVLDGPSPLGQLDAITRGWFQHLEYAPLLNARAHQLGGHRRILNEALAAQYRSLLDLVAHRAHVSADDLLGAAHYLLCMDRVEDALALLARVGKDSLATRLQHDYLAAYCACYRGDLAAARELAAPWRDHPVDRWRDRYAALLAMLDEVQGITQPAATPSTAAIDPDSRDQRMAESAARQPALDLAATGPEIVLQHHNLASCQLRFYRMDVELVFSRQPFVQGDVERFSFVEPGLTLEVALAGSGGGRTVVPIPTSLRGSNLVIEAVAPGLRRSVAHYTHDLGVQVAHAYGQIRVVRASTQAPLPATYVKVYGRQPNGRASFFKDGYTDLLGRFDYATLSTDDLDRVERFALLVVSDEAGATIVEAAPPAR